MRYTGKNNAAVNAKCPFFCRDSEKQITCEGYLEGTNFSIKFQDEGKKDEYLKNYCMKYPNSCPINNIIESKYEQPAG